MHTFRKRLELELRSCRSCSAKSTEREIKRCQALKPEMRTGMKTKVVFNTFVWYLCDVWLVQNVVMSYHTQLVFGSIVCSKPNMCVVPLWGDDDSKCHANHSPWTAVQPHKQSSIWPRLKCALATIERKAVKLRLHRLVPQRQMLRFWPSFSILWKLLVNLLKDCRHPHG